jgi:hypothetical protein
MYKLYLAYTDTMSSPVQDILDRKPTGVYLEKNREIDDQAVGATVKLSSVQRSLTKKRSLSQPIRPVDWIQANRCSCTH